MFQYFAFILMMIGMFVLGTCLEKSRKPVFRLLVATVFLVYLSHEYFFGSLGEALFNGLFALIAIALGLWHAKRTGGKVLEYSTVLLLFFGITLYVGSYILDPTGSVRHTF